MKLALILMLLASGAMAQERSVDRETVAAWFDSGRAGAADLPACVGEAAARCQAQPGGDTTLGMAECLTAEAQAWQGLLEESLTAKARELGQINPELEAQLTEAQSAWEAYRDAECGLRYAVWIAGSIRTIIAADCHLQKTAARALEVARLGEME
jgi:uncharacterized protein YecT (DUF1311 family)